jgi:CHAT domain-containing protein
VDDQATSYLMEQFYANLKKGNKREALRQAQLATKKKYEHPYYWAAFELTGRI